MELGPKPSPRTEPPEMVPGGPDAPGYEPTGVVRDIRASSAKPAGEPGPRGEQAAQAAEAAESGGMGVSSERVGHTGPGQRATDGVKDTSSDGPAAPAGEEPPEQRPGHHETNPPGPAPKAERPSLDPRSQD